ncbi:MAG: hypothetical protein ACEQSL_00710 [Sediminibacterium sp.]
MKYLFAVIAFLSTSLAFAIENYQPHETLSVLTLSGIKLRDKPGGAVLQSVPYAAKVITLEAKNNNFPFTVEGIKGAWVKVNFNDKIGYVFDGFLSRLPAPSLTDANLRAYVKREFKMLSEDLPLSYLTNNDLGASGNTVLFLEWNGQKCAYENHFYYEGGGENLSIPGVSIEEAYLLVRIIEREAYEYALKEMEHPDDFDSRPYTEFLLNGTSYYYQEGGEISEVNDYYFCDLTSGCDYQVTINKHENFVLINIGGGC